MTVGVKLTAASGVVTKLLVSNPTKKHETNLVGFTCCQAERNDARERPELHTASGVEKRMVLRNAGGEVERQVESVELCEGCGVIRSE